MFIIAGNVRIDPSKRDIAIAGARILMEATRKEPGCISYNMTADLTDPALFYVFEKWESSEALAAHFQTSHMAEFQRILGEIGGAKIIIQRYNVSSTESLEL